MNYITQEEILEAYKKEEFPLLTKYFDKSLGKERAIYNFENKKPNEIIFEILALPLPNGNKHLLLLEMVKLIRENKL